MMTGRIANINYEYNSKVPFAYFGFNGGHKCT